MYPGRTLHLIKIIEISKEGLTPRKIVMHVIMTEEFKKRDRSCIHFLILRANFFIKGGTNRLANELEMFNTTSYMF